MGIAKRIIRYRINSWFLSSQLGTVGHTVRTVGCSYEEKSSDINGSAVDYAREFGIF